MVDSGLPCSSRQVTIKGKVCDIDWTIPNYGLGRELSCWTTSVPSKWDRIRRSQRDLDSCHLTAYISLDIQDI